MFDIRFPISTQMSKISTQDVVEIGIMLLELFNAGWILVSPNKVMPTNELIWDSKS